MEIICPFKFIHSVPSRTYKISAYKIVSTLFRDISNTATTRMQLLPAQIAQRFSVALIHLVDFFLYLKDSVKIYNEYQTSFRGRHYFYFKQLTYFEQLLGIQCSNTQNYSLVYILKRHQKLLESPLPLFTMVLA